MLQPALYNDVKVSMTDTDDEWRLLKILRILWSSTAFMYNHFMRAVVGERDAQRSLCDPLIVS